MEKQNALRSFIDNTGLEPDLAAQILSEVNWDVGRGIQRFQDHVRTGRIKSVYPPPQVSAGWAGPTHRPPGEGPPGYSRLPGNPLCPQWSDPYGEVRNPPVERIIPIERVPNKGHSVMTPINSSQPVAPHHSSLTHRFSSTPPVVAPKPVVHTHASCPPPISAKPPGPNLQGPYPDLSGSKQLVNMGPTMTFNPQLASKSTTQTQVGSKSVTQPQVNSKSVTQTQAGSKSVTQPQVNSKSVTQQTVGSKSTSSQPQAGTKSYAPVDTKPSVISGSAREPAKATSTTKPVTSTNISSGPTALPHTSQGTRSTPTISQSSPAVNESIKKSSSEESKAVTPSPAASPHVLKRGFSKIMENESLVDMARKGLLEDITESSHDHMFVQTFILPDLTVFSSDYRAFLEKDLIETSTLVSLEQAGRLNWWAEMGICQRLLPMATTGDGNCLLHAASLAMWGIHDRQLMLRRELYETLTKKSYRQALYRRWRWQQAAQNKQADLIFSEDEWQTEWNSVLKLASTEPRIMPGIRRNSSCCDSLITNSSDENGPVIYESLEEFHVFVLSHILQRVIIVVADTVLKDSMGEALAPIPFGGIYLPLECDPKSCYQSPLLLTYDAAHFSALVPMETDEKDCLPTAIPLVDPALKLLPVHFLVDPGPTFNWDTNTNTSGPQAKTVYSEEDKINLLNSYLQTERLPATHLDYDSDCDRRSGGSTESDDNTKKRDKQGTQPQGGNVTKQFGSLGKSINKKLKKNFGSVGKALKNMGPESKLSKKGSVGSGLTQSTRVPMTIAAFAEQDQSLVLCAKVSTKQTEMHKEMIKNYMLDARHRFQQDRQKRQARGEEIRRRSMEMDRNNECINPGCKMFGHPETHYMCSKCFNDHKQEAVLQEKYKTGKQSSKDTVESYGKSKFYIPTDEEEITAHNNKTVTSNTKPVHVAPQKVNLPPERPQPEVQMRPQSFSHSVATKPGTAAQTRETRALSNPVRARTPSPDYDNVDYSFRLKEIPVSVGKPSIGPPQQTGRPVSDFVPPATSPQTNRRPMSELVRQLDKPKVAKACKTAGCDFFGSPEQNDYCSACFKKIKQRQDQQQLTRV